MCVSHYSGSPCIQRVQLQTSLSGVAKGLSRQRWSDQKIPGSLKYTTRALPLLTARLACREQTSPDKYTDKKKKNILKKSRRSPPTLLTTNMLKCDDGVAARRGETKERKSKGEKTEGEKKRHLFCWKGQCISHSSYLGDTTDIIRGNMGKCSPAL